jgi:DNA replication protein
MNNKIIDILKDKNYVVPYYLMKNYKYLNLDIDEFVLLIYLLDKDSNIECNYVNIAEELGINKKDVMIGIENLKSKGILEIKISENKEGKLEEYISLDLFFNKIFMHLIEEDKKEASSDIYSSFEREFGRTLSPIEYELISGWIDCNYDESLILEALREAVLSGVNSLRYIDRILFEWSKKGIRTVEQARKNKEEFNSNKDSSVDVPDFDWLNNDESL